MYNLAGAPPHLKITGTVLANIFLGTVKKWNDPAIKKLNPGVNLPDTDITPIFRSDGSGTTYNFTDYLVEGQPRRSSRRSASGRRSNFPAGVGGRGSSGVSAVLSRTNGGITYVDVAFATEEPLQLLLGQEQGGQVPAAGARGRSRRRWTR